MAIETQAPAQGNKKEVKPAEGYLNLKIADKHGNFHTVPCYIPLTSDKPILKALLAKAGTGETEVTLQGYINLVSDAEIEL